MVVFGRKLELVNVQQTKKEVHKVLSQEALEKVLKAAYLAKKKNKKRITSEELRTVLQKNKKEE